MTNNLSRRNKDRARVKAQILLDKMVEKNKSREKADYLAELLYFGVPRDSAISQVVDRFGPDQRWSAKHVFRRLVKMGYELRCIRTASHFMKQYVVPLGGVERKLDKFGNVHFVVNGWRHIDGY